MTVNLDAHIAQMLDSRAPTSRPLTINDLSRHFGVSAFAVRAAANRLIDSGLATGSVVDIRGTPTLHSLHRYSPRTEVLREPTSPAGDQLS